LLVLSDGANWIRGWYEGLKVPSKRMILCWYHVKKRIMRELKTTFACDELRYEIGRQIRQYLWEGKVEEALRVLFEHRQEAEPKAWTALTNYLIVRQRYFANYGVRWQGKERVASTHVEKFNDHAVSARCKQSGMSWTVEGVAALAALEAARRNGELATWRQTGHLPSWPVLSAAA
jgi:hypothetical protein